MKVTRGIRSLCEGYSRNFADVPDTEETFSSRIILETSDENYHIKLADSWPDFISLDASISADPVSGTATIERTENGRSLGKMNLYASPKIDSQSRVQNTEMCCARLTIDFENTGEYQLESENHSFTGKSFDEYELKFQSEHVFEKKFMVSGKNILEKCSADSKGTLQIECSDGFAQCLVYPYAGYYCYGAHPRQIEQCVFRTSSDGKLFSLSISSIGELKNLGINAFDKQISPSGHRFVGITGAAESQKLSLYEELQKGACKIIVSNKSTNEKSTYKSCAVKHTPKTNLITINFIKEE